jgi:hypothetical protein
MIGALRLFGIAFVVLSVFYLIVRGMARYRAWRRLGAEFDAGGVSGDRDTYIKDGLDEHQNSLKVKLFLGIYVVPLLIVATLIYVTNFM